MGWCLTASTYPARRRPVAVAAYRPNEDYQRTTDRDIPLELLQPI